MLPWYYARKMIKMQEVVAMRLLVAEDERDLLEITVKRLKAEGYGVDGCSDGADAAYYLENAEYDLAVLDIMMPQKSGLEILRELRARGSVMPVLLLTALDSVGDRVAGLDSGADDYLTKPFSYEELLARIRVLLRRHTPEKGDTLSLADLTLTLSTRTARRGGRELSLSSKEFALLEYMLRNQGTVLTRSQLENHVWDYGFEGGSNIVDVYVRYLRRKVDEPFDKKLIHTVRGTGYVLKEEA